jgi:hypothetical protein
MRTRHIVSLIAVVIVSASLFVIQVRDRTLAGPDSSTGKTQPVFIEPLPPSSKDAVHALIKSADVPLSVHQSCSGVGTDLSDKSIGEYISGFLVELDDRQAENTIETTIQERRPGEDGDGWTVRVMIGQVKGEVVWRWGVEYRVHKEDGLVVPASFRCLGAG